MEVREASVSYLSQQESDCPPGYKKTEVGVVPEDWNIESLDSISKMKSGESITSAGIDQYSEYPCYGGNGLRGFTTSFTHDGSYALIGRQGALCGNVFDVEGKFFASEHAIVVTPDEQIDIRWLTFVLKDMNLNQYSESSAQPGLSVSKLLELSVGVPPTKTEQEAIAGALSDTDALIESLEQLIAKNRHIKQGAMQELLRPKDGWTEHSFPDVCWFQEGPGVRNYQFTTSGVKLFNGTNIEKGKIDLEKTNRFVSEGEAYGWYSHFLADAGDIVIACSGITVDKFDEKVAELELQHLPLCMNTSTMRFKIRAKKLKRAYLKHFLRSNLFKEQISGKATGSAQLNFGPSHVSAVKIWLPLLAEQHTIANTLDDIDNEITTLETKLAKLRQLKQGMMHELLTGRIRLI